MKRVCPHCGEENPDAGLWCKQCNAKLVDHLSLHMEEETVSEPGGQHTGSKEFSVWMPKPRRCGKVFVCFVPVLILVPIIIVYFCGVLGFNFGGINCTINEDFWFEGGYLNTSDGWSFTMTKVKDYVVDGVVLGLKTYSKYDFPYRPINVFSPIDLIIGVDDVKDNPEKYPYSLSYSYRGYWATYTGDNAADGTYLKTHMGNHHIIPHNEEVLNALQNISVNDYVVLEGSLVNLDGTRGDEQYQWTTDTRIGNFDCEIILVDTLTVTSSI